MSGTREITRARSYETSSLDDYLSDDLSVTELYQLAAEAVMRRREAARQHFMNFVRHTVRSGWKDLPHQKLLAEALEAVEQREIRRLMVFVPPRYGKSELVSRRFPVWYMGRHPEHQMILACHTASLANELSADAKAVATEWWPRLWKKRVSRDTRAKAHWKMERHRAKFVAAGVGGPITGRGADVAIIDDPIKNWDQARSQVYRDSAWMWYTSTLRTRLHPNGAIILVMTRWHPDDLAGRLLDKMASGGKYAEQWEVVKLKAIWEPTDEDEVDPLGRDTGDVLAPDLFPPEEVYEIRDTQGEYIFSANYQQDPRQDIEGALWRQETIDLYRLSAVPEGAVDQVIVSVDPAETSGPTSAEHGIVVVAGGGTSPNRHAYILADYSRRGSPHEMALAAVQAYYDFDAAYIRAESNAGGEMITEAIRTVDPDVPVKLRAASSSKKMRAYPVSIDYERGLVHHIGVLGKLEAQLCNWDGTTSFDRLDALVHGVDEVLHQRRKAKRRREARAVKILGGGV